MRTFAPHQDWALMRQVVSLRASGGPLWTIKTQKLNARRGLCQYPPRQLKAPWITLFAMSTNLTELLTQDNIDKGYELYTNHVVSCLFCADMPVKQFRHRKYSVQVIRRYCNFLTLWAASSSLVSGYTSAR